MGTGWLQALEDEILEVASASLLSCGRRLISARRVQEQSGGIGAISADPTDGAIGDCEVEDTDVTCTEIEGAMTLYYTSEDAEISLYENMLFTALKSAMDSGVLDDAADEIIVVEYLGPELSSISNVVVEDDDDGDGGVLSKAEKASIVVSAICLALLALFVLRRKSQQEDAEDSLSDYSKPRRAIVVEDGYFDSPGGKTVNTHLSGIPEGDEESDSMEFKEPQYNDLGRDHSTLDVHRCTSATCPRCTRKNQIKFIKTPISPPKDDFSETSSI